MENHLNVKLNRSGTYWVSYQEPKCEHCGQKMKFCHHSRARTLIIDGKPQKIIQCYYQCVNEACTHREYIVAKHPEMIPNKQTSKSTFAKVINQKYHQKLGKAAIIALNPELTTTKYYEIINAYRAASRSTADERLSQKYPEGTKVRVSIDGIEVEKGQPGLYTVRTVEDGDLLGIAYLKDADAEGMYQLLHSIEVKYGVIYAGFVSDRQKSIVAAHDQYYSKVPHQYCIVHYFMNTTKAMLELDQSLQKDLRSEVRNMSVLKSIKVNLRSEDSPLAENERLVLAETKDAILAVVNQKKTNTFELVSLSIYVNLSKAMHWLEYFCTTHTISTHSQKFLMLLTHVYSKLKEIITEKYSRYQDVGLCNLFLHPIFDAVTNPDVHHPKRAFIALIKKWETAVKDTRLPKNVVGALEKALKFARSYEPGLFLWRKAKLPSHNNGTESFYHKSKGRYRYGSPNMKIGITMELSGLEELYIPHNLTDAEITTTLNAIGTPQYRAIRKEMAGRSEHRTFERGCRTHIIESFKGIFKRLDDE
jgi:hypothetical protein